MEYNKPTLVTVGNARTVVLGIVGSDGDSAGSPQPTKPAILGLGLDD
jgi:hypothetical protein